MFNSKALRRSTTIAAFAIAAMTLVACGDSSSSDAPANAGQADAMFVNGMIPHHQAAVDMAELARERAEHAEVRELADDIIASQNAEIKQMQAMQSDLAETDASAMSDSMMKSMNDDAAELEKAENFDKAFLLAMIPHHEMAVTMSKAVQANGKDPEVDALATSIIAAQQREITEMRAWLKDWYGATAPESSMGSGKDGDMDHPMH